MTTTVKLRVSGYALKWEPIARAKERLAVEAELRVHKRGDLQAWSLDELE